MYFYCVGNKRSYFIKRNFYYIGNRELQLKKSKFYYTGNRDIGCKNLMSLLLFGLKNDLLQIMSCGDIVAATVLENTGIVMKCFKILVRNAQVKILLKTLSAETAVLKIEFDDDIVATKKLKGN